MMRRPSVEQRKESFTKFFPMVSATGAWFNANKGMAEENLRINRMSYQSGTITMSDLLQAQTLYQQALDKRTDAFADYQNKILAYKHAVGE